MIVVYSVTLVSIVDLSQYVTTTVRTVCVTTIEAHVEVHRDSKESVVGDHASRAQPVQAVRIGFELFVLTRVEVELYTVDKLDGRVVVDNRVVFREADIPDVSELESAELDLVVAEVVEEELCDPDETEVFLVDPEEPETVPDDVEELEILGESDCDVRLDPLLVVIRIVLAGSVVLVVVRRIVRAAALDDPVVWDERRDVDDDDDEDEVEVEDELRSRICLKCGSAAEEATNSSEPTRAGFHIVPVEPKNACT